MRIIPLSAAIFAVSTTYVNAFSTVSKVAVSRDAIRSKISLCMSDKAQDPDRKEPIIDKAPTEPGSHEELMYCLGVNLGKK